MKWNVERMEAADLIHGPDSVNTDTYRLRIEATEDEKGIMLDVPGWMVGDKEGAELRMQAAEIIRKRLCKSTG